MDLQDNHSREYDANIMARRKVHSDVARYQLYENFYRGRADEQ